MLKKKSIKADEIKVKLYDHGQLVYKDKGKKSKVKKNLFNYLENK